MYFYYLIKNLNRVGVSQPGLLQFLILNYKLYYQTGKYFVNGVIIDSVASSMLKLSQDMKH